MSDERLLRLPFDHYARYRLAADVVDATRVGRPGLVLDVGGGPGSLAAFCTGDTVIASDLNPPSHWHAAAPSLALADGGRLPFAHEAFDLVVTLDTLEHVAPQRRPQLLREAVRVSRGWVLVVCPCATPGVAEADTALLALVRERFGEQFETVAVLGEHVAFGHPDPEAVCRELRAAGGEVARFPSGRLDRWLPMMVLFYHLLALGADEPVERVQAWYNRLFYRDDLRDPAYRQAFLCRLPDATGPGLDELVAGLLPRGPSPAPDAAAQQAISAGLSQELAAALAVERGRVAELEGEHARLRAELDAVEGRAARAGQRAASAELRAAELEAFRARVLGHPAVRLGRRLRQLLSGTPSRG